MLLFGHAWDVKSDGQSELGRSSRPERSSGSPPSLPTARKGPLLSVRPSRGRSRGANEAHPPRDGDPAAAKAEARRSSSVCRTCGQRSTRLNYKRHDDGRRVPPWPRCLQLVRPDFRDFGRPWGNPLALSYPDRIKDRRVIVLGLIDSRGTRDCRARSCHRRWHSEAVRCSGLPFRTWPRPSRPSVRVITLY
jgi:hypothetical protein